MTDLFDTEAEVMRHGAALRALAVALVGDRDAVEDVVQETWLRAVERPPRHEAAVGGWLATVLRHFALRRRRGEVRRVLREQAAARGEAVEDAAVVAAREEMLQRVVDAVRGLEQPYRDAIWQRFFEGLMPAAMAAKAGVPLATVKSRLQRGLQMLRARMSRDGEEGEWRTALAVAFGVGGGVGVASATGVVLMGTGAKVVVGAATVTVAALLWWAMRPDSAPSPSLRSSAAAPAAAPISAPDVRADLAVQRVEAGPPAAVPMATPAADGDVHLRGRLVAAEDGSPLAGARITMDKRSVCTDRAGAFQLDVEANAQVYFKAACDERVTCTWRGGSGLQAGQTLELGDLPMRTGILLHGQLVDAQGVPVAMAGVHVMLGLQDRATDKAWSEDGVATGETDAHGSFRLAGPVPFGKLHVEKFLEGKLLSPTTVEVDAELARRGLTIVFEVEPEIRGIVVDESGKPVAGIHLSTPGGIEGLRATSADGTFRLRRPSAVTTATTRVLVFGTGAFEAPAPMTDVAWGSSNLRIVLRRSAAIELLVVDESGAPVTGFGVTTAREGDADWGRAGAVRLRGEHVDGRVQVDCITPGHTQLRVLPSDVEWTPSEPIHVAGTAALRVVLARREPCRVLVMAAGRPVAAARVQLAHRRGAIPLWMFGTPIPLLLDPRTGDTAWMPGQRSELVSQAETDPQGIAKLWRDREPTQRLLVVEVEGRPPQLFEPLAFPADGSPWRVELAECGSIAGRVELRGREAGQVQIDCEPVQTMAPVQVQNLTPGRDGAFASPQVPAGSYRVVLNLKCRWQSGGRGSSPLVPVASAVVIVAADRLAAADFDLQDFALASLRGRVGAEGMDAAHLKIDLVREGDSGSSARRGEFAVAADGTFTATDVPPGSWRLAFRIGEGKGEIVPAVQGEAFALQPGETAVKEFALVRRRLVVHLRQADGSPATGLKVRVRSGGCGWPATAVMGIIPPCEESMVFDPAPATPIRFSLDGVAWSDPVQMPQDRTEAEVTVALPDATPR